MATKSRKAMNKRRPTTKVKRPRSKPLIVATAVIRREKLRVPKRAVSATLPSILPVDPTFAMFGMMASVMRAYAEIPDRLVQCRSPMDLWLEPARLTLRILNGCRQGSLGAPASR